MALAMMLLHELPPEQRKSMFMNLEFDVAQVKEFRTNKKRILSGLF